MSNIIAADILGICIVFSGGLIANALTTCVDCDPPNGIGAVKA